MFDAGGRLQVANREYERLIGAPETELKQMPPTDLLARINARLRPPVLPELGRQLFLDSVGELEEEVTDNDASPSRLFYRSRAPVRDIQQNLMGHITVYRDVSQEVESERMKAEVLRLRTELETTYALDGIVGKKQEHAGRLCADAAGV